ncbi:MAG: hypothetical protein IKD89_03400 [Clostridia bacterium]|nr:hypothetical protein [Clostridia bacterium]
MFFSLGDKLDFLMKLTNTKNSALARALSFDPSYISRIRSGKRGVPKNQPFIEPASVFFAKNVVSVYQKKTLADAIGYPRFLPDSPDDAAAIIAQWLSDTGEHKSSGIGDFLSDFSDIRPSAPRMKEYRPVPVSQNANTDFFYGNSGKRKGVERFLSAVCASGEPQTLLLFSDEDMSWLLENAAFTKKWASLLARVISQGGRIKIIHTTQRNIGEMLEAINKWLPLYFSGAIEPYYCPRIRDGVYRRSLFIAQGHSALISDSLGEAMPDNLSILINDREAVSSLEGEFRAFLSICRPLVNIYTPESLKPMFASFSDFHKTPGSIILAHSGPSFLTLPESAVKRLLPEGNGAMLLKLYRTAKRFYTQSLKNGYTITEVINLPSVEKIMSGNAEMPLCGIISGQPARLTADEYVSHLEAMIKLMRKEKNYRAVISDEVAENVNICIKEYFGVILFRTHSPSVVFKLNEPNLTSSFEEYLKRIAQTAESREQSQKKLAAHLNRVKKAVSL